MFVYMHAQEAHHLSIPAFSELLSLRKAACDELYQTHIREAAALAGDPAPRVRKAREADCYVAGRIVKMRCPSVSFEDQDLPATIVRVLWSIESPELWVELKEENLDYLRLFMKKGLAEHCVCHPAPERRRKKLRAAVIPASPKKSGSPKKKNRGTRKRCAAALAAADAEQVEASPGALQNEPVAKEHEAAQGQAEAKEDHANEGELQEGEANEGEANEGAAVGDADDILREILDG